MERKFEMTLDQFDDLELLQSRIKTITSTIYVMNRRGGINETEDLIYILQDYIDELGKQLDEIGGV